MNIRDFNNAILFSNKNLEKQARSIVNESCNAVLMEMYEDKCILADHTTGQIFEANYSFDGKTFVFENFVEKQLEKDDFSLREAIGDFFDDKAINLAESYEKFVCEKPDALETSLTEAIASKNLEKVINYNEIIGEEIDEVTDAKDTETFKLYEERLDSHPLNNVKVFDWVNPVKVAVIDEDCSSKLMNKSLKKKAKEMKSKIQLKKELKEAAELALDGDSSMLEDFVHENVEVVALDKAEIKELVGMSVIGNKNLMESRNKIAEMINDIIEEDSDLSIKKSIISEEDETEGNKSDAPEANEQDVAKIKDALEKAKEAATDEKLISKIDTLIKSLDDASESGETDVSAVKESVSILSLFA